MIVMVLFKNLGNDVILEKHDPTGDNLMAICIPIMVARNVHFDQYKLFDKIRQAGSNLL